MGTYIAIAAPADLYAVASHREPYATDPELTVVAPIVAVYVDKSPTHAMPSVYALGNGQLVWSHEVKAMTYNQILHYGHDLTWATDAEVDTALSRPSVGAPPPPPAWASA